MTRRMDPMYFIMLFLIASMAFRQATGSGLYDSPMDWVMDKVYLLPGILIGFTFHEFAHAKVADKLGDSTPRNQGRVTTNPLAHMDPVGFISLLFLGFGWGKPVEIDSGYFKHPRKDTILVTVAGVTMNLILAILFSIILKVYVMAVGYSFSGMTEAIYTILLEVVVVNLVLMIFNLMPIPPLDGFNLLTEIFDLKKYSWWYFLYRNGFLLLAAFIIFDISGRVITPILRFFLSILYSIL